MQMYSYFVYFDFNTRLPKVHRAMSEHLNPFNAIAPERTKRTKWDEKLVPVLNLIDLNLE